MRGPIGVRPARASITSSATSARSSERSVCARMRPARRVRRRFLEAGRVDQAEVEIGDMALALAAVASDARQIIDERQPPADKPVEQCRLADIGPPDDRDGKRHQVCTLVSTVSAATQAVGLLRFYFRVLPEPTGQQLAAAFQNGIRGRRQMCIDALEVTHDVELKSAGFHMVRRASARSNTAPVARVSSARKTSFSPISSRAACGSSVMNTAAAARVLEINRSIIRRSSS